MKLAVTGKGGVGKTTICALLAHALNDLGYQVYALDTDPDANLASALGHPDPSVVRPLIELKELIRERTGAQPGSFGSMFRLNPFVADIPERYSVMLDGVRLLVAGSVKAGGSGCYCPENTMVKALVSHLLLDPETALVLDMEAGIEHLSRGTVAAVNCLIVVVEPSRRSVETAFRIREMAGQVGLTRIRVVANRIASDGDREFLAEAMPGWDFVAFFPADETLRIADRAGRSVTTANPAVLATAAALARRFRDEFRESAQPEA